MIAGNRVFVHGQVVNIKKKNKIISFSCCTINFKEESMKKKKEVIEQSNIEYSEKRTFRKKTPAWDKLDNTANLFPVIANEDMTNVYRISVSLTEEIDRVLLQEALNRILPQFPIFRMRLRMGFFWYYFEENTHAAPIVREEYSHPGAYIDKSRNHHYMFRVTYHKCRINLEVFHVLTDGAGGLIFLKELLYQYLRLRYPEILEYDKDKISAGIFLDKEDSYVQNFKKGHPKVYKSEKALTLTGERVSKGEMGVMHGYLPVKQLKKASNSYGVTMNQYLVGTFIYAIYKNYLKRQPSRLPIRCCVPVNLRPYYNSHTMKNFFAMVFATFEPDRDDYSFEQILEIVAKDLKEQITPENLDNIMSYNVSNEKKWILRAVPLVLKNVVLKQVYGMSTKATSATVTNIGKIELKEPYQNYVDNFTVILSMSKGQNMKGAICSYGEILTFTFSSVLVDTAIQRAFFQRLAEDGVMVSIESNGVIYE